MDNPSQKIVVRAMQWNDLSDIGDVKPLSPADAPVLAELRAVLMKHGALDRFGVTLLHKHFELRDGEALVEEVDFDRRALLLRPGKLDAAERSIDTAWRFDADVQGPMPGLHCFVKCRWKPGSSEHSGIQDHV